MTESDYDAVWAAIRDGHLSSLYIWEAYWLAEAIVRGCDEVEEKVPPVGEFITVDPEIFRTLASALGAAGRLRALLVDRPRNQRQTAIEHAIQVRRARWLRTEVLDGVRLDNFTSAGVRNSLEHFDEYLDRLGLRWLRGRIGERAGLPMDMVLSSRAVMSNMLHGAGMTLVRVYVAQERRFVNSDEEIDVTALREDATRVRDRLQPLANPRNEPAEKRGSFIVLPGRRPHVPLPD